MNYIIETIEQPTRYRRYENGIGEWTANRQLAQVFTERAREICVLPKGGCWVIVAPHAHDFQQIDGQSSLECACGAVPKYERALPMTAPHNTAICECDMCVWAEYPATYDLSAQQHTGADYVRPA